MEDENMDKKGLIKKSLVFSVVLAIFGMFLILGFNSKIINVVYADNQTNQTGSIYATSTPTNADIYIDSVYKGLTPVLVNNILVGSHTITASKLGYNSESKLVNVTNGATTNVSFTLSLQTGNVYVTSNPSSANVYLDGSYKGLTPVTINNVQVGNHIVNLSKMGYGPKSSIVSVSPGLTTSVNFNLTIVCTDTDKTTYPTRNPNLNGTATAGASSLTDYCQDGTQLTEYYCQSYTSTTISTQFYDCLNGCSNGACI